VRQRGGIGSIAHDPKQKDIRVFFGGGAAGSRSVKVLSGKEGRRRGGTAESRTKVSPHTVTSESPVIGDSSNVYDTKLSGRDSSQL
jgi:hypothetical protein